MRVQIKVSEGKKIINFYLEHIKSLREDRDEKKIQEEINLCAKGYWKFFFLPIFPKQIDRPKAIERLTNKQDMFISWRSDYLFYDKGVSETILLGLNLKKDNEFIELETDDIEVYSRAKKIYLKKMKESNLQFPNALLICENKGSSK